MKHWILEDLRKDFDETHPEYEEDCLIPGPTALICVAILTYCVLYVIHFI